MTIDYFFYYVAPMQLKFVGSKNILNFPIYKNNI